MESQALKSNTLYCVLLPTVRECTMDLLSFRLLYISNRVSIRKTFAQFLRNETQNFLSLRISFARKNNNLRNHSQKSFRAKLPFTFFAKLKFCAILQLEFCAIPQFVKIKQLVTVCVS